MFTFTNDLHVCRKYNNGFSSSKDFKPIPDILVCIIIFDSYMFFHFVQQFYSLLYNIIYIYIYIIVQTHNIDKNSKNPSSSNTFERLTRANFNKHKKFLPDKLKKAHGHVNEHQEL